MIRTQIYLSEEQRKQLASLAIHKGENMSELVREAIAIYIAQQRSNKLKKLHTEEKIFKKAFGMWKDNTTDFVAVRKSADRIK